MPFLPSTFLGRSEEKGKSISYASRGRICLFYLTTSEKGSDQTSFEDILLAMFILKALTASPWLYMKNNVCHRVPDDPKKHHSLWDEDTWERGKPEVCGHPGTI